MGGLPISFTQGLAVSCSARGTASVREHATRLALGLTRANINQLPLILEKL